MLTRLAIPPGPITAGNLKDKVLPLFYVLAIGGTNSIFEG